MTGLAGILEAKRHEVTERRKQISWDRLESRIAGRPRSLYSALARPGFRFILEVKQASPSSGTLRTGFDPASIAASYDGVADAVSVLTESRFFRGSLDDLAQVRQRVEIPVIAKDFVLDPYQVIEARAAGADAILLMLSVLDDASYQACARTARSLGMDVLSEVHDERELDRALALEASIIGINNRDLKTMSIDLETTVRLAPRIPPGRLVVSESGIRDRADVERLAPLVRLFLVGTALMRSPDTGQAARRLVYGEVKVCGLTRPEDAHAAYRAGATYGGLVFAAGSRRLVEDPDALAIRNAAPLKWVGVFVAEPPGRIIELASTLRLAAVQLHGDESPRFIRGLRPHLPQGCEIWKGIQVRDRIPSLDETAADRLVLDAFHPTERGGTGRCFDWSLLVGGGDLSRVVLAGGLTAENAARARQLGCGILDVSSGVESSPGIKDAERLRHFFEALRR